MTLHAFVTLAVLVEVMTGMIKSILQKSGITLHDWMDQLISLILAVVVAFTGKVDFFAVLNQVLPINFSFPAFLGILLSALIMSRGSNALHDLIKQLNPPSGESMRLW